LKQINLKVCGNGPGNLNDEKYDDQPYDFIFREYTGRQILIDENHHDIRCGDTGERGDDQHHKTECKDTFERQRIFHEPHEYGFLVAESQVECPVCFHHPSLLSVISSSVLSSASRSAWALYVSWYQPFRFISS